LIEIKQVEIKQVYSSSGSDFYIGESDLEESDLEESDGDSTQDIHRVQFIHESVRDFLLHYDGLRLIDPGLGEYAVGKSHDQLTKAYIGYLSIEEL